MDRLSQELDGRLHLMDRQLVDEDGLLIGKVDDVELTEESDGVLVVSGLLAGGAALVPRLGGRLGSRLFEVWAELAPEQHLRRHPWRIDMADVDRLESAVHLSRPRVGVLRKNPRESAATHRLGHLLGMEVTGTDGPLGRVVDVRLRPEAPGLVVTSLIVGRARPGTLLGYDRSNEQGPWVISRIMGWLHRHTGLLDLAGVEELDWAEGRVRASEGLQPLGE